MIYENLYSKTLYVNNSGSYGVNFKELRMTKAQFGSGIIEIVITDGYKDIDYFCCPNLKGAIRVLRKFKKEAKEEVLSFHE